jgi:gas vesicle protein
VSVITKTLKFTGGTLLGLGIGALTALLLTPQSGEINRAQLQARLNEILDAGRRAQHATEDELQARWESQVQEPKKNGEEQTVVNKPVIKAEQEAERRREQQEKARKEAERHLDKAGKELDKARTKL